MNNEEQEVSKKNKEKRAKRGCLFKFISTFLDFIGLRFIYLKIKTPIDPETGKRKPQTFLIWIVTIYVALFTIASQRYENRIDIIENRVNAIFLQLQSPFYKYAFRRIGRVQEMKCPIKPEIWKPVSIILFPFQIDTYSEAVDLLIEVVETWKDSLSGVILYGANLSGANLSDVNLSHTDLRHANLKYVNLRDADLKDAYLYIANFTGADLKDANLNDAECYGVNFSGANLTGADLRHADLGYTYFNGAKLFAADLRSADLSNANLTNADLFYASLYGADLKDANLSGADLGSTSLLLTKNLTIEQLLTVRTLKDAKLDSTIVKQFKKLYPDKWEELRK